jgi:hypothetical protein
MRDIAIAYAPYLGPILAAALLGIAGLLAPYLPGPIRAVLRARKVAADSTTHRNDTDLVKGAVATAAVNAAADYAAGRISKDAALEAGVAYVRRTVRETSDKIGITDTTLAEMVGSRLEEAVLGLVRPR